MFITVKSKGERFRRAGIEFSRAGVDIDASDLTRAQTLALVSEPNLTFLVDGKVLDRPTADQLDQMRQELEEEAAEQAQAKAAEEAAAAKAADEAAAGDATNKNQKAGKKSAK